MGDTRAATVCPRCQHPRWRARRPCGSSLPRFNSRYVDDYGLPFGLVGLVMTGLLSWALWLVGRTRRRALNWQADVRRCALAIASGGSIRFSAIRSGDYHDRLQRECPPLVQSYCAAGDGYTEEKYTAYIGLLIAGDNVTIDEPRIRDLMAVREQATTRI